MPAKDTLHSVVRNALIKDGWIITHDPLKLEWGGTRVYVDLGAEKIIAAEKGGQKIAVEVKGFLGSSAVDDLEDAYGQFSLYLLYLLVLDEVEPDRILYLAVPNSAYERVFQDSLGRLVLKRKRIQLIVFDPKKEEIVEWIR